MRFDFQKEFQKITNIFQDDRKFWISIDFFFFLKKILFLKISKISNDDEILNNLKSKVYFFQQKKKKKKKEKFFKIMRKFFFFFLSRLWLRILLLLNIKMMFLFYFLLSNHQHHCRYHRLINIDFECKAPKETRIHMNYDRSLVWLLLLLLSSFKIMSIDEQQQFWQNFSKKKIQSILCFPLY